MKPNGARKSTTVKIMLETVGDYTGEVEILEENISNGNVEYKRKLVMFMRLLKSMII